MTKDAALKEAIEAAIIHLHAHQLHVQNMHWQQTDFLEDAAKAEASIEHAINQVRSLLLMLEVKA